MRTKVEASCSVTVKYRSNKDGSDRRNVWLEYDYEGKQYSARVANLGISDMLYNGAVYTGHINPRNPGFIRISPLTALREMDGLNRLTAVFKLICIDLLFPLLLTVILYFTITL